MNLCVGAPLGRGIGQGLRIGSLRWLLFAGAFAVAALTAASAPAVLIAGPDGTINVTAPSPDPGFANVGDMSGLSGVYLTNGWVLTAGHVGAGEIELDGVLYQSVPGSRVDLVDGSGGDSDLILFKLTERPPLPDLELAAGPVSVGESVVLVGNGRARGASTSWMGMSGWEWGTLREIRWGTNRVSDVGISISQTDAFSTRFDRLTGSRRNDPEAQVVPGDSGGAAFAWRGGTAELIGILFAQGLFIDQPAATSLFGNSTYAADLYTYRGQILPVVSQPDCDDGLDEDGDGRVDFPDDPGCLDPFDESERDDMLVCDNGLDDDLDGWTDFPADLDCLGPEGSSEVPEPGVAIGLWAGALFTAGLRRVQRGRAPPASTGLASGPSNRRGD